jgi:hypothetical protein
MGRKNNPNRICKCYSCLQSNPEGVEVSRSTEFRHRMFWRDAINHAYDGCIDDEPIASDHVDPMLHVMEDDRVSST